MKLIHKFVTFNHLLEKDFIDRHCELLVSLFFHDFWNLREETRKMKGWKTRYLYDSYLNRHSAFIGLGADFKEQPTFPHGFSGIFISNSAIIGNGAVIFHQVTIGSNTLEDSRTKGAPIIGNNVYIGSGAKIIGNVTVGDNARIGANCIVVKDVPPNSVAVMRGFDIVVKTELMNNEFITNAFQKNTSKFH